MDFKIILDLILILFGAILGGVFASKIKAPVFVGYIIGGILVGFFAKSFLDHNGIVPTLSEIGVALLLFTLGIEFSLSTIKRIGRVAIYASTLQLLVSALLFFMFLYYFFHLSAIVSLFLAFALSFSSTVVVAKIFDEKGLIESSYGELILAWLIIQDLSVVPVMLILNPVSQSSISFIDVALGIVKSFVAIYLIFLLGKKTIPYVFKKLALYNNRELLLLASFLLCISFSYFSQLLGLSFAIGAFLAGILISMSAVNHEVFTEIRPLRDLFASVFFVTLGFQFPYDSFTTIIFPIIVLTIFVIIAKIVIVFIISVLLNYHSKIAFYSAFALFEVGEFSFVLGKMGLDTKILSLEVYQILIFTTIITLVISPFIFDLAPNLYEKFKKYSHKFLPFLYKLIFVVADSDAKMPKPRKVNLKNHVVLVGYGRVGKFIGKLLEISKIDFVVIDMQYKTLYQLRKRGFTSIYGDAVNKEILHIANLQSANAIIIATPDIIANELIIKNVRELNPSCLLIVRAHKEADIARLTVRGVKHIIEPEFEAGVEMGKRLLKYLKFSGRIRSLNVREMRREYKF